MTSVLLIIGLAVGACLLVAGLVYEAGKDDGICK